MDNINLKLPKNLKDAIDFMIYLNEEFKKIRYV
jgi:hypothetical protein